MDAVRGRGLAATVHDRLQFDDGAFEVVVDDDVLEFGPVPHVRDGVAEPALDDLLADPAERVAALEHSGGVAQLPRYVL